MDLQPGTGSCPSRRAVLAAAGVGLAAPLLAACGGGSTPAGPTTTHGTTAGGDPGTAGGALVALADVPVGSGVVVETAAGDSVVVVQPEAGTVHAFSAVCTHEGCLVAMDGAEMACPCHGSRFTSGGQVANGPAARPLPAVAVAVRDGEVVLA